MGSGPNIVPSSSLREIGLSRKSRHRRRTPRWHNWDRLVLRCSDQCMVYGIMDRIYAYLTGKNEGVVEPEFRLRVLFILL